MDGAIIGLSAKVGVEQVRESETVLSHIEGPLCSIGVG
jgi:hypothetical protein